MASAAYYIYKCAGYRVEILATNRDTCNDTELPTMYDLIDDVLVAGVDEEDDYYLYLPVTDNYFSDYPLLVIWLRKMVRLFFLALMQLMDFSR